jgi:ectoine hydroxylase-related dioxygenase (phytanoyl-CoA dioxygenase family)
LYFSIDELNDEIRNGQDKIKNYFDTFGFVVIKKILKPEDFKKLYKEYDAQFERRTNEISALKMLKNSLWLDGKKRYGIKYSLHALFQRVGMRFLPNFVDSSEIYSDFFLKETFFKIYKYFAGENWLYLGSDGSNFVSTSFPWHRDWFTKIQVLKFNFYYNPIPFLGGKFLIVPGSNFPEDTYSQLLQKCMSWPRQNKLPGGLSENKRLHQVRNPRNIFNIKNKNHIDIPSAKVILKKGDVIIFDQRTIHCVQNNFPQLQRRLMTILLSKNAFDFPDNHLHLINNTREELMREVVDLVVSERNHIGCEPYGNHIMNSDFINSNHFISIAKSDNAEKFDTGSIKYGKNCFFKSVVDFNYYANIGMKYRIESDSLNDSTEKFVDGKAQDFSYEDVHLGINAQNIKFFDYK